MDANCIKTRSENTLPCLQLTRYITISNKKLPISDIMLC